MISSPSPERKALFALFGALESPAYRAALRLVSPDDAMLLCALLEEHLNEKEAAAWNAWAKAHPGPATP